MKKSQINRRYIYGILTLIIVAVAAYFLFSKRGAKEQTLVVQPTDFVSTVSVSGKVVAIDSADLGFDQSGRVSKIFVGVGDTVSEGQAIAALDSSDITANIAQKEANLQKEQAKLAALEVGTRPEELAIYEQKLMDASTGFVVALKSAYLQVEGAVTNKADTLFTNGDTVNPVLTIVVQSDNEKRATENERLVLRDKLVAWKTLLAGLSADATDLNDARSVSSDAIMTSKNFFDHLGSVTANLNPGNSGLSQSAIDTYKVTINAGAQAISSADSTEQVAEASWRQARDSLNLQKSGSTVQDIDAQVATVRAASADLDNAKAVLEKTTIYAPFEGIVTKMDLKIGEIATPSDSKLTIMTKGAFQIESYVPEINIASISVGEPASVTLDAYGDEIHFGARIISVDPAETVRDGVSTYKIKLQFDTNDDRIKSGMTANVVVTTANKSGVVVVPQGIVKKVDGKKFVTVKIGGVSRDVPVETGGVSSFGQVEITSGLAPGDVVVLSSSN